MSKKRKKKVRSYMSQQDKWSVGEAPKECTKCDHVGDDKTRVLVHPDVLSAIFYLCREVKSEWQMLLVGSEVGNTVTVDGYYIPKQEVTAASVKNLEAIDEEFIKSRSIVATIHSHADMTVFFSAVDDECTNMSWIKHHLVVNNKGEFIAKTRHDLACGMVKFNEASVETLIPNKDGAQGSENITKKVYGFQTNNTYTPPANRETPKAYIPWYERPENGFRKNKDGIYVRNYGHEGGVYDGYQYGD